MMHPNTCIFDMMKPVLLEIQNNCVTLLCLWILLMISLSPSISEISLTVAEEGRPTKESEKAHQIEKCDCPVGYSGLSCEVGRTTKHMHARTHTHECTHEDLICAKCGTLT